MNNTVNNICPQRAYIPVEGDKQSINKPCIKMDGIAFHKGKLSSKETKRFESGGSDSKF